MLLSPNFFMTQNQSSVIKFSSFIFLPPEFSDSKTMEGGNVSSNIYIRGTLMLLSPNFFMPQSQSSVIKCSSFIFLAPEVSDNKPRVDGERDNDPK